MSEHSSRQTGIRIEALDAIAERVIKDIKGRDNKPELPTGIDGLDQALWGIHRSELTVISARTGEGKSTLALQICKNLAELGKKAVFVSLEMTSEQLVERLLVQFTQHKAWDLRIGDKVTVNQFVKDCDLINGKLKSMNLRIVERTGKSIEEVTHLINEIEEKAGEAPDVLVIDYVQLIRGDGMMQKRDVISDYLNALADLAKKHNMAVIVCSQLNRDTKKTKKGRPSLINLKDSGSIEEVADCVILCWWEELGTEEKPEGFKYWLLIGKQRFGSPGAAISVNFDKDKLTFYGVKEEVSSWSTTVADSDDVVL